MVLFLAISDWANVGYNYAEALKSVGVDVLALKKKKHAWQYSNEAEIYTTESLQNAVKKSNIIIWMHSKKINVPTAGKKLFVFHGGSEYRKSPKAANAIFNEIVSKSIIQTGDLLNMKAKNECWLLPPIDTDLIQPVYKAQDKLTIAHYPSNASNKNSTTINQIMQKLQSNKFRYLFSGKRQNWEENIKRMSECDIYIDALCPTLNGKKYGEWGLQALEAAALGKVVVTHFASYKRYQKEYGSDCALQYVNTVEELESKLKWLINLSPEKLLKLKHQTRYWVENNHSFQAVGKKLKKILEI